MRPRKAPPPLRFAIGYVARQLGHDARLTLTTYGHVMDEFEDAPQVDAHTAIADARAQLADGRDADAR